jgi:uncharacterized membrane protein YfcA
MTGLTGGGHSPVWWIALSLTGLLVGFVSGLFGVGGGFLLTPLLTTLFGVGEAVAVGTGLCQMVGAATAAQIRYVGLKQGEIKLGVLMIGGGLVGVSVGSQLLHRFENAPLVVLPGGPVPSVKLYLSIAYVILLTGVALWMAWDLRRAAVAPRQESARRPQGETQRQTALLPFTYTYLPRAGLAVSVPAAAYVGLGMGFLSGLMGIGGGVILIPLLVYGFGLPIRSASATGVVMLLATSLWGTVGHARLGHVDLSLALALLAGSTLGAQWGAVWGERLDGRRLRGFFVLLVGMTAVLVAGKLVHLFTP